MVGWHQWIPSLRAALIASGAAVLGSASPAQSATAEEQHAFFEEKVRPLLISRCYDCHSAGEGAKIKGGLRLDHREGWVRGGDSGPALIPGDAGQSLLVRAVRYRDPDLQMPPKKKLDTTELEILEAWIAGGAFDPRDEAPSAHDLEPEEKEIDYAAERDFWSFQSPDDPALPGESSRDAWTANGIDALLLSHWKARGRAPAPEAHEHQIVRRLAFALTGLPPSVLDLPVESFSSRPDARERYIDRLLASPRYGERWGRHWLDVARYADSNGMDENKAYVQAFRYRDYVVESFNSDLPFDAFTVEQLAGDLLADATMAQKVATGYLSVGPKMLACDDPQKMRMDIVDEQIDTTGRTFLGMTFGCARCHDHKFDPIAIEDYYGLAGIFMSTKTLVNYKVVAQWHEYDYTPSEIQAAYKEMEDLRKKSDNKKLDQAARDQAKERLKALEESTPPRTKVMGVTENEITNAKVHFRGNYLTLGEETTRQVPVLFQREPIEPAPPSQSGRLQLAEWIASPSNPLTARVLVNRLWRWHFGMGIVPSTENFGKLGSAPRDLPLLDHLAHELVRGDWSIKRLQRTIAASSRYSLSSTPPDDAQQIDLNKELPSYHPRQRLDAESLRDSLLGLAATLNLTMHGQLLRDQPGKYVNSSHLDNYFNTPRRSVYLPIIRSGLYGSFVAFDMADPSAPNGNRRQSVVAPQSLYLMNSEDVRSAAQALAERLPETAASNRLQTLYQALLHRSPTPAEIERAQRFLDAYSGSSPWPALVRVLFASNEFLYLD